MDKFVSRAPTWKTMNYSNVASSGYGRVSVGASRSAAIVKSVRDHKPLAMLQNKPIDTNFDDALQVKRSVSSGASKGGSRLSIRDERLLKIFSSQPDQPLIDPFTSDSGCSSSSDSFPCCSDNDSKLLQRKFHADENTPPLGTSRKNNLNLADGNKLEDLQGVLLVQDLDNISSTPPQPAYTDLPLPCTPKENPYIMRIQRDLNSPSASARLKALKAMKSPTKSAYSNFDVPHDEQSIITAEERQALPLPPVSIQELMQNIIVYVEVRTGEDNRSAGVKKVISALGAKVNDKLLRDTTHVIFKDGLLSTYKKAKSWNIPVVSILWIEACKNQRKICDPFEFPISNIDRYENPELYEKIKRHKSMQPDSEANKRVRAKPGTPKDSNGTPTPKSGALKKTSTLVGATPTSTNKKTDISRFFKQLGSHKKSSIESDHPTESPATQLLNKISEEKDKGSPDHLLCLSAKKTLNFEAVSNMDIETPTPTKMTVRGTQAKRTTMMVHMAAAIEATTNSLEEISLNQTPKKTRNKTNYTEKSMVLQTPSKDSTYDNEEMSPVRTPRRKTIKITTPSRSSTRRRNTMNSCVTVSANISQDIQGSHKKTTKILNEFSTITEEETTIDVNRPDSPNTPKSKKTVRNRRTIFSAKSIQITHLIDDSTKSVLSYKAKELFGQTDGEVKETKQPDKLSDGPVSTGIEMQQEKVDCITESKTNGTNNKRRTLFTPQDSSNDLQQSKPSERLVPAGIEIQKEKVDDITKRKTNAFTNKRRTLFTPQKHPDTSSYNLLEKKVTSCATECLPGLTKTLHTGGKCLSPKINKSNIYGDEMLATSDSMDLQQLTTPTPIGSSTLMSEKVNDIGKITQTPPQLIGSLLEEHSNAAIFSSTRDPGRRRTLFDVSMDIISQRLQNINQSSAARRSMARPSNYDLEVRRNSLDKETPKFKSPVSSSVSNVPIANTSKKLFGTPALKAFEKELAGNKESDETTVKKTNNDITVPPSTNETAQTPIIKKKRKLFAPNESLLLQDSFPAPSTASATKNAITTTPRSNVKRRRTLMPLLQPQSDAKIVHTVETSSSNTSVADNNKKDKKVESIPKVIIKDSHASRRSTLDFEAATQLKICTKSGAKKIVLPNNKTSKTQKNTGKSNNTSSDGAAVQNTVDKSKQNTNASTSGAVLVYTNMHKGQIETIKQAIAKLGFFTLQENVSNLTTHVVSLEPRRTLNIMRALCRGLWILEFNWIEDSLRAGVWLSEEQYEMKDFSRAVEICRVERQAFGKAYKSELFSGLGSFYLPTRCGPLRKQDLAELIQLCGGKISDQRHRARFILGDANRQVEERSYVTPFWILDSITQMQLQKISKYAAERIDILNPAATSSSQQSSQLNGQKLQTVVIHDAKATK